MRRRELLGGVAASAALMGMGRPEQVLLALQGSTAPSLDLNFLSGGLDSRIAFTRASIGTYYDSTGTMQTAASGAARFDYGPTPGGVTNWVRNSTMVGAVAGSPGTLPTNWSSAVTTGVAFSVIGSGVESGLNYVDVRLSGTAGSTSGSYILFDITAAAALGQTWTTSAYIKLVSGSFANLTAATLNTEEHNSSGGQVGATATTIATATGSGLSSQRFVTTRTFTNATACFAYPGVVFNYNNGAVIDVTLRIGAPQLEQNTSASAWVPTSSAAANAGAVPLGLLIEEARTNIIRNNSMAGAVVGTPGTYPTNWSESHNTGIIPSVVSFGTENGIAYVDLRFNGTTAGGVNNNVFFDGAVVAATPSQTWTSTFYMRLVGGSMTNIANIDMLYGDNIANVQAHLTTPTSAPLAVQRYATTWTTNAGAVTQLGNRGLQVIPAAAPVAIDITLRIGLPQWETGAFATSAVPTSSVAVTRVVETTQILTAGWFSNAIGTLKASFQRANSASSGINQALFSITDGGGTAFINYYQLPAASGLELTTYVQASPTAISDTATHKFALTYNSAGPTSRCLDGTVGSTTLAPWTPLTGLDRIRIGEDRAAQRQGAIYIGRITYWPRQLSSSELIAATSGDAPALDLDFVSSTTLDPRITFTRASAGTYFDATGTLQSASTNVARYDYGATPGGTTNWIINSTMIGAAAGTPGTLPTNWAALTLQGGLSSSVIGTGTDSGLPYIDIRLFGTTSNTTTNIIPFGPTNVMPGYNGQAWAQSAYIKYVNGSLTGITSITLSIQQNSGNSGLGQLISSPLTISNAGLLSANRQVNAQTVNQGACSYVNSWLLVTVPNTTAIDITLRLGAPQMEVNAAATAFIPTTSGAAVNVGALPKGLLIEEARTNGIRNNTAAGAVVGTPGTLPTNWQNTQSSGLTPNVIATGTENGVAYVDLQFVGTASAGVNDLWFDTTTGIAALTGQNWVISAYLRVVGGTTSNFSGITPRWFEYTAGGVFVAGNNVGAPVVPTSAALSTQRLAGALTTSGGATTAFIRPGIELNFGAGAVNITIRIGLPQTELGGFASSPIQTSSVAVTRAADVASMPASTSWFNGGFAPGAIEAEYLPEFAGNGASSQYAVTFDDGTANNRLALRSRGLGSSAAIGVISSAGASVGSGGILTDVVGTVSKLALAWSGGAVQNSVGNAGTVQPTTAAPPASTLTTVEFGALLGGSILDGWLRRIRYWPRMLPNTELQSVTT